MIKPIATVRLKLYGPRHIYVKSWGKRLIKDY